MGDPDNEHYSDTNHGGFCDTALAPYYGEALTCHLLKIDGSGPRVNIEVDSGPFHIRLSGVPSGHQPKAPAHTVRFLSPSGNHDRPGLTFHKS